LSTVLDGHDSFLGRHETVAKALHLARGPDNLGPALTVDARSLLFILLDFVLSCFAEMRRRACTVQARRSFF
jgi:hypothetical protein